MEYHLFLMRRYMFIHRWNFPSSFVGFQGGFHNFRFRQSTLHRLMTTSQVVAGEWLGSNEMASFNVKGLGKTTHECCSGILESVDLCGENCSKSAVFLAKNLTGFVLDAIYLLKKEEHDLSKPDIDFRLSSWIHSITMPL